MDVSEANKFKDETNQALRYKSQDGFVRVPIYRGFSEIEEFYSQVRLESSNKCVILGGYVRFMCSPHPRPARASDVDLYCPEQGDFEQMVKFFSKMEMTIKHENDVSISYNNFEAGHPFFPCPEVQLIKPMAEGVIVTQGSLEEIISNFDFTVIRIGLLNNIWALADADFTHDETNKLLRIKRIHCPVSSLYRVMKYRLKGYWPPSSLIVAILQDWNNRDEDYKKEIVDFFVKAENQKLEQEEIDRMERLLRLTD